MMFLFLDILNLNYTKIARDIYSYTLFKYMLINQFLFFITAQWRLRITTEKR